MARLEPLKDFADYQRRVTLGPPFPPGDEMKFEQMRKFSFSNWSVKQGVDTNTLAELGFLYAGDGKSDHVKCYNCNATFSHWSEPSNLVEQHRQAKPACPLLEEQYRILTSSSRSYWDSGWGHHSLADMSQPPGFVDIRGGGTSGPVPHVTDQTPVKEPVPSYSQQQSHSMYAVPSPQLGIIRPLARDNINRKQPPGMRSPKKGKSFTDSPFEGAYQPKQHQNHSISSPALSSALLGEHMVDSATTGAKQRHSSGPSQLDRDERYSVDKRNMQNFSGSNERDPRRRPDHVFYENMKSEVHRKQTYYDWPPHSPIHPTELAAAGFFYSGQDDRTCCAFCKKALYNWIRGDVPMDQHRQHLPRCPFVQGMEVGNIPAASRIMELQRPAFTSTLESEPDSALPLQHFQQPPQSPQAEGHSNEPRQPTPISSPAATLPDPESSFLDTAAVRTVLSMGFDYDTTKTLVEIKVRDTGSGFADAESLIDALLAMDVAEDPEDSLLSPTSSTPQGHGETAADAGVSPSGNDDVLMLDSLRSENLELKEQKVCKACKSGEACFLVLPCSHLAICARCAKIKRKKCPQCHRNIKDTIRCYRP